MSSGAVKEKDRVWADSGNALMRLNEVYPNKSESYAFSDVTKGDGPAHNSTFSCVLSVGEQEFHGNGRSKQASKRDAAELALHTLFHEGKLSEGYTIRMKKVVGEPVVPVPTHRPQASSSAPATPPVSKKREHVESSNDSTPAPPSNPAKRRRSVIVPSASPLYVLNNKHTTGVEWEVLEQSGPPHAPIFRTRLVVDGSEFIGEGASKRLSRGDAARRALSTLDGLEIPDGPMQEEQPAHGDPSLGHASQHPLQHGMEPPHSHSQVLANRFQRCCMQKFIELRDNLPDAQRQFKVMAGIVQLRGGSVATEASATVVSLATGTKGIHGENLSLDGTAVNDCHAEVLARRAFCMYVHDQIRRTASGEESVFERVSVNGRDMFALNPVVSFHLFISSAPCGDSRLFTVSANNEGGSSRTDASQQLGTSQRNRHGKLRQKIEAGEGGVLCESGASIQTLDGLAAGERLRTMCCSDKVARWNCLGIQGCLLSRILFSPIYFETVTVGDVFNYDHMYRAVYGRLAGLALPKPFFFQRPYIAKSDPVPDEYMAAKSSNQAMNWFLSGSQPVEVLNCSTGKCLDGSPSRLCKRSQGLAFMKTSGMLGVDATSQQISAVTYNKLKSMSHRYQECKLALFNKLANDGLGAWVHKPVEQEQFLL
ncbi:double-stranded RNA-specific editase 1-like [Sycon ciliatum]|uniref:double-stranded RNA-specific editase 1-like n=1 Tax=Sycon ciliatum TaxID=27933 RepID=UPI0031F5F665